MEDSFYLGFNPFETHLLGAVNNYVYLKEIAFNYDDETSIKDVEDFTCVLKIKQSIFKKMCKDYLARKEDYCTRLGYFCGAGSVYVEEYKQEGTINILLDIDDETPIYGDVPLYKVSGYSIEMEHG